MSRYAILNNLSDLIYGIKVIYHFLINFHTTKEVEDYFHFWIGKCNPNNLIDKTALTKIK